MKRKRAKRKVAGATHEGSRDQQLRALAARTSVEPHNQADDTSALSDLHGTMSTTQTTQTAQDHGVRHQAIVPDKIPDGEYPVGKRP